MTDESGKTKQVLIVGCPRSGSTWTTFLMSQQTSVSTFQHAKVFDYLEWMRRWYRNKAGYSFIVDPDPERQADGKEASTKLREVLSPERLDALLGHVAEGIFDAVARARPGASVVVDKTPENGLLAPFILKVNPDAYFLHVVRDPRAVFCSHRSASRSWAKWEFPTRPLDGARYWKRDVEAALEIDQMTDRYLQVRYEDLRERGPAELGRILSWVGLEADEVFLERAVAASTKDKVRPTKELPGDFVRKTPKGGWRDELSARDARLIEWVAGDLMESLGYERSQPAYRSRPPRVAFHDAVERILAVLEQRLGRATNLAHWGWVGRKLEWPEP
jgi:hypothetical protein